RRASSAHTGVLPSSGGKAVKDIFVARQPIFDARKAVVGHELLYRASMEAEVAEGVASGMMSSSLIVDAVLDWGLDLLTDGARAYINFTSDMLLSGAPELLDPQRVVLEVLEEVEPTPDIIDRLRALSSTGYMIALDDFVDRDGMEPMLEIADIVKIDVGQAGDALTEVAERLRHHRVRLLAEKVESHEEHERCLSLGFELF